MTRSHVFRLLLLVGAIPVVIVLGTYYHLGVSILVVAVVGLALLLGTLWLWYRANNGATGQEWWQDNNASGWRGY